MNLRNNRGVTGADISVALIVVVLFVGIIATLAYNFQVTSKSVSRKAMATNIAISKIEDIKESVNDSTSYDNLQGSTEYKDKNGVTADKGPYTVVTEIVKYSDLKQGLQDVIKIVKVTVSYSVGNQEETIDLSTTVTRGE